MSGSRGHTSVSVRVIPRRYKEPTRLNFIRGLQRVSLIELSDDEHESTCAICRFQYGTVDGSTNSADDQAVLPEEAVRLPCCKNLVGNKCLSSCKGNACPFCRAELTGPATFQSREEDFRRWLCWLIRRHGKGRAVRMYDRIIELSTATAEQRIDIAVRLKDRTQVERLRDQLTTYHIQDIELKEKAREQYAKCNDTGPQASDEQNKIDQLKSASAIVCIEEELAEPVLSELAAQQITDEDLRGYISDEEFGAYGFRENYRLTQPGAVNAGIAEDHVSGLLF